MITEYLIRGLLLAVSAVDALIPPIAWPSFMSAPIDWMQAHLATGSASLNAVFAYVHPVTVDIAVLTVTWRALERLVMRARALLSTATGGGGAT